MTKAKGVNKRVTVALETTFGTPAEANLSTAEQMRRVQSDFNLKRDSYESAEIRFDHQTSDMRLGTKSVDGSINGELSPGTYSKILASALKKDFVVGTDTTGLSVTIEGPIVLGTSDTFTITRGSGSFIDDTFKVGTVVRLTGAGLSTANKENNILITNVTALELSVKVISSVMLVAEGPITPVAITTVGKISYVPQTGHTDQSFTVEEWYSDIAQSEVYTGNKVSSAAISIPATGLATSNFSFMGKDRAIKRTSAYFTNAAPTNTKGIFSAVNSALIVNGDASICVTSLDFTIERAVESSTCIGTNSADEIFVGRVKVTGNFSAYFENGSIRDLFDGENKISLVVALTTTGDKNSDFMTFVLPNVMLTDVSKADAELSIIQTVPFTALLNTNTDTGLVESTIMVQDSTL